MQTTGTASARRQPPTILNLRIAYDSRNATPAAGTRGSAQARHLVYLTEEHLLDVQMAYRQSEELTIVGHIVNKAYRALPDLAVRAVSEHGVLEQSVTGPEGEFEVACQPLGALRLQIAVSDAAMIELPLPSQQRG